MGDESTVLAPFANAVLMLGAVIAVGWGAIERLGRRRHQPRRLAVVLFGAWGLLRDALHLALDGVPKGVDLEKVRTYLLSLPRVESVHDLHIWAMSTTEVALTAHLVMPWRDCPPAFLAGLEHDLDERFGISQVTVQSEPPTETPCARSVTDAV